MEKERVLISAISKWGKSVQVEIAVEECAELIKAIQKNKRYPCKENMKKIEEEIADVEIMIKQLRLIFNPINIDRIIDEKIKRLEERLINQP